MTRTPGADGRVEVVHVQRRPHPHQLSIERVFATVRSALPARFAVSVRVSSHMSSGVLPRLRAVLEGRTLQGCVTHVTGDVHYVDLLMRRRTTVLTVHDCEFLLRAGPAKRWLYSWLWLRLPVLRAGVVTVVSEQTRRDLVQVLGRDPGVRVIPNPVRHEFVASPPRETGGCPVVLLLGTWPNKNVERSVQALVGLDVRVVVVGPLDETQTTLLDGAGLTWLHRPELDDAGVVEAYRDCDLLLFPSLAEGFGMPIVEAQASGRPVVTSLRPPMSDVAGGAACLVDPLSVESIRAGVVRVLTDEDYRDRLVCDGARNAQAYAEDVVAARYAEVYDEMATGTAPARVPWFFGRPRRSAQ